MIQYKLQWKTESKRQDIIDMIICMAKYGNHYDHPRFTSQDEIRSYFALNRIDFDKLVTSIRQDYTKHVPLFENLVGSAWRITEGATATPIDLLGNEGMPVDGPGSVSIYDYFEKFQTGIEARDRAIDKISFSELQVAIVLGYTSIEAYLHYQAETWNKRNPKEKLTDSSNNKVSIDDKIKKWIPIMTKGKTFDKNTKAWIKFKELKNIRDNIAIHPKTTASGISDKELASLINIFNYSIPRILIQLHVLFHEPIPAIIIRTAYSPEVELIEVN